MLQYDQIVLDPIAASFRTASAKVRAVVVLEEQALWLGQILLCTAAYLLVCEGSTDQLHCHVSGLNSGVDVRQRRARNDRCGNRKSRKAPKRFMTSAKLTSPW